MHSIRKAFTKDKWKFRLEALDVALKHRIKAECEKAYQDALDYLERNDKKKPKYQERKDYLWAIVHTKGTTAADLLSRWAEPQKVDVQLEKKHHEEKPHSPSKPLTSEVVVTQALAPSVPVQPAPLESQPAIAPLSQTSVPVEAVAQRAEEIAKLEATIASVDSVIEVKFPVHEPQPVATSSKHSTELEPSEIITDLPSPVFIKKQPESNWSKFFRCACVESSTVSDENRPHYVAQPSRSRA